MSACTIKVYGEAAGRKKFRSFLVLFYILRVIVYDSIHRRQLILPSFLIFPLYLNMTEASCHASFGPVADSRDLEKILSSVSLN